MTLKHDFSGIEVIVIQKKHALAVTQSILPYNFLIKGRRGSKVRFEVV
jgi:hypothetical protein